MLLTSIKFQQIRVVSQFLLLHLCSYFGDEGEVTMFFQILEREAVKKSNFAYCASSSVTILPLLKEMKP